MAETPSLSAAYLPPPEGWKDFGYHAPLSGIPLLEFSKEEGEDGLPRWERHLLGDECTCEVET